MKKSIALLLILNFMALSQAVFANDAKFIAKTGEEVMINCEEDYKETSILVSFDVKLPYETADENFAVKVISSDEEITSFIEFSGGMFKLLNKSGNIDIPESIKPGKKYTFGFVIDIKNMKQNLFAASDDGEYFETEACDLYSEKAGDISNIEFSVNKGKGEYEISNVSIRKKSDVTYPHFLSLFHDDLNVKIDRLDDIKGAMDDDMIILCANTPYAITKEKRVLIDSGNDRVVPKVKDNYTYVPLRFISEKMGAMVGFEKGVAQVFYNGKKLEFEIGKREFKVDGVKKALDAPAYIENGRTMVPVRAVSESLGKEVLWQDGGLIAIAGNKESMERTVNENNTRIASSFGIYVSDEGDDTNSGTKDRPLKTFAGARKYVKRLKNSKGIPEGGIAVFFKGGEYFVSESQSLTAEDSGCVEAPITYRAYMDEKISLNGGTKLSWSSFEKVKDEKILSRVREHVRGKLYKANLKTAGVKILRDRTYHRMSGTRTGSQEFYVNSKKQTLARWPNGTETATGTIVVPGSNAGATFRVSDDAPIENWGLAEDPWIQGTLKWSWAGESVPVTFNVNERTIRLDKSPYDTIESAKNYYVYNLLEEIDVPGEWYIDRDNFILYWYPREDINLNDAVMSVAANLTDPVVVMDGVQFVNIEDFTIEGGTEGGVAVKNAKQTSLSGLNFKNLFVTGLTIEKSEYITVKDCNFNVRAEVDDYCGDSKTLRPGRIVFDNCYFANWTDFIDDGLHIGGVGNIIRNCEFTSTRHQAITIGQGNDIIIENCEIYDTNQTSSDAGAIYSGRTWRTTGNILKNNAFHDISDAAHAVYWDDGECGNREISNIFFNSGCTQIKGASIDSLVDSNVFIKTGSGILDLRQYYGADKIDENTHIKQLIASLNAVPFENAFWSSKFPYLKNRYEEGLYIRRMRMVNNIGINLTSNDLFNVDKTYLENDYFPDELDNVFSNNHNFKNVKAFSDEDWRNWDWSWLKTIDIDGFKAPDIDKMGVQLSENRSELPSITDFSLLYPSNGSRNVQASNMEFVWEKCSGAVKSKFTLAKDPEFKNIVYEKEISMSNGVIPDCEYEYGNTTYYWKVEAVGNAMKHNEIKQCQKVYSFTTAKEEYLDLSEYDAIVREAEIIMKEYPEGDGKYHVNHDAYVKLPAAIAETDAIINADDGLLTGKIVSECTQKLAQAVKNYKKSINPGHTNLFDILPVNSSSWVSENQNFIIKSDNSITFNPTSASETGVVSGFKEKVMNHNIWTFKANFNYNSKSWQAISLRASGATSVAWTGGYSYIFIFKPDVVECQKFNGASNFYDTVPNEFTTPGQDALVEIAALDVENGVRLILRIDGKTVFDKIDKDGIIDEEGYISCVSAQGAPLTISSVTQEEIDALDEKDGYIK